MLPLSPRQKRKRTLFLFSFSDALVYNRMTVLPFAVNAMPNLSSLWSCDLLNVFKNKFNPIRPEAGKRSNTFDLSKLEVLGVVYEQAFS